MLLKGDFEAKVRFLTKEEGGRSKPPIPGYRGEIRYDAEERMHYLVTPKRFFTEEGDCPEACRSLTSVLPSSLLPTTTIA